MNVPRLRAYIGMGSNLGDRQKNFLKAIEHMTPLLQELRVSPAHISMAVDRDGKVDPSAPPFLNGAVTGFYDGEPHQLLAALQAIEIAMGRHPRDKGQYKPRFIDLDILFLERGGLPVIIDDVDLVVPHPRLLDRDFVLIPLEQLGFNPARAPRRNSQSGS